MGLKTRYEIAKRIKPFVDVAYQYEKGQKLTSMQQASNSEKGWLYGAGIEFFLKKVILTNIRNSS